MKKRVLLALAFALLLTAAGCARSPAAQPEEKEGKTEQKAPSAPSAAPDPAAPYARPEVESNGGSFVRVDEKIWFRYYDEGAIDEPQLWGEFFAAWPSHPVASKLCFYDTEGDAVMEMFPDDGFGELWFGLDGFYLTRVLDGGAHEAYHKALDGTESVLGEGTVAGVSDNGRFAAVQNGGALAVYEGTERKYRIVGTPVFCALTDDGTLLYSDGADCVERMDVDGHIEILGVLPELPEGIASYGWEFEQCLVDGNDVWCAFGAYEGTGHFLADVLVVRAKLDTPGSLEAVDAAPDTEYPYVPRLYRDASGAVRMAEHAPGDAALSEGAWGGLIVYGEDGKATTVAENLLTGISDEGEMGYIAQSMETIGNAVYLAVAKACHDPDNDIGWRMAYLPDAFYYLRAPSGGGVETLYGPAWEAVPDAGQVYAGLVGTWSLRAVEIEGDRSDTLPGGMTESVTFYEGETRVVIDGSGPGTESYYNDFDHAEALPANGAGEDAAPYGLLFTGEGTDDMMYAYLEGDTLVATVMLRLSAERGGGTVTRTGFYERAEG